MRSFATKTVLWAAALAILLMQHLPAAAGPSHVALVFGNSNYKAVDSLANPSNDAEDIAVALSDIGYDVTIHLDADYETMRKALSEFARKSRGAEIAFVYFAGHGIEIDKHNYLIPVDAALATDTDVPLVTIPLDYMLTAVSGAKTLRVVLLDACRNNPFLQKMRSAGTARRSLLGRGLAAIETETGTLVGFSAKEGTTASDGAGRNSPYATALLHLIRQPRLDAGRMFRRVRDEVMRETNNQQEPFVSSSLPGEDVFLHPAGFGAPSEEAGGRSDPQPQASTPDTANRASAQLEEARLAWDAIRSSDDPGDYETFLEHYGDSIYAKFAQHRKERLEEARKAELEARLEDERKTGQSSPTQSSPTQSSSTQSSQETQTAAVDPQVFKSPEPQWYMATYTDLDLFGGDIYEKGLSASSFDRCSQLCGDNLACRAFTFNPSARRCFLKNGYRYAHIFQGAQSGFFFQSTADNPAPTAFDVDWEVFDRSDITGIDLGDSHAESFESCRLSCERNGSCNGFAFVPFTRRKQCWLKTGSIQGPVYNRNAAKGITSARRVDRTVRPDSVQRTLARN